MYQCRHNKETEIGKKVALRKTSFFFAKNKQNNAIYHAIRLNAPQAFKKEVSYTVLKLFTCYL